MANYGMVKTYRYEQYDDNGKIVKINNIKMVFNVMTYIIYQNYTGRDLQADFQKMIAEHVAIYDSISEETKQKLNDKVLTAEDFATMPESDVQTLMKMSNPMTNLFLVDFIASLIATAKYPTKVNYEDIIYEIPMEMLTDESFANELFDFMRFGVPESKKKLHQAKL